MPNLDYKLLAELVNAKIERESLSLRDVSAASGVSTSTLSRITRAVGRADADITEHLCEWLGVKIDQITTGPKQTVFTTSPDEPTLSVIRRLLNRDKKLSPEARDAIYQIMEVGYNMTLKYWTKRLT